MTKCAGISKLNKIAIIAITFIVTSCMAMQEPIEDATNTATEEIVNDEAIQQDSLRIRYIIQTDPIAILLNHVSLKNGQMILDLSEDDAFSLGISKELYYEVYQLINVAHEN